MRKSGFGELEIFADVARLRSFRKAAIERGVSTSALSQAMRQLEDRLGTRLLNRTTRSVAPTEAGEQLLSRLGPAFQAIAQALDQVNDHRQTPTGTIRINAPQPAIEACFLPLLKPFLASYPEVRLEIISDAANIDIVKEGFDAGVRFGNDLAQDMIAVPLGRSLRYVVVGSPNYFIRHGTPRHPKDLVDHSCIGHRFPSGNIFSWKFNKANKSITVVPKGRLVVSDARHAMQAAVDGIGLARVLEEYTHQPMAKTQVNEVLADWAPHLPSWFLYYPSRHHIPAAMRALLQFIAKRSAEPEP